MKKSIFTLLVMFCFSSAYASMYAYYGVYGESTLEAYPGAAIKEDYAKYRAGLHLEKKFYEVPEIGVTPFIENEVLMDDGNVTFYNPSSSNFTIGLKFNIYAIDIIIQHECRHAFEFRSKQQEQYNLMEFRWYLQR